jgi:DNA-binding protein Fis
MDSFKEKIKFDSSEPLPSQTEDIKMKDRKKIVFTDELPTLKETEKLLIDEALKRADGNQTIAAQLIGLTRRALNNRLSRIKK